MKLLERNQIEMLDIKPVQNQYMMCRESILASVANYFNHDYEVMFADTWYFDYSTADGEENMIDNLKCYQLNLEKNYEKYHRIKVCEHVLDEKARILDLAKSELQQEKPMAVYIDSFYCPLATKFEKETRKIFPYLIAGINDNELYCLDIHRSNKIERIEKSDFLLGVQKKVFTYEVLGCDNNSFSWESILKYSLDKLHTSNSYENIFESIEGLAGCIENSAIDWNVYDCIDFSSSELFKKMTFIVSSRYKYGMMLKYLGEKFRVLSLEIIALDFGKLSKNWTIIRASMQKAFYKGDIDSQKLSIAQNIRIIAENENVIANKLSELLIGG